MAEPEAPAKQEKGETTQAPKKAGAAAMLTYLMPVGVAVLFIVLGFAAGRLFGTRGKAQNVSAAEIETSAASAHESKEAKGRKESKESGAKGETWFYETEPVIVNLNEPGLSRYVRVCLTLEVGNGLIEKEGRSLLDQKKPLVRNLLTLFLASLTTEDCRGDGNLRRLQSKTLDILNQGLFPDTKPRITRILFKELSTQ